MLNRQTKVWGINYENPAIFEKSLFIFDAVGRRSPEGGANQRHSGSRGGLDHALHGRTRAQRR